MVDTWTRGSRRSLLAGAAAFAGGALAAPFVARGEAAREPVRVSVGRIPWAAANAPVTQHMIAHKLFEARAADQGYALTVDWRDYPTALPMVEALIGNTLDIGMWGNTPIIRAIANRLPVSLLAVGEGHQRFVIATRADSPLRTIQDLRGKTVGALLGGDPFNAFAQMLRWELGSANPRDHGIRLVNIPTLAQAAQVPAGLDATSVFYPAFLPARATGSVAIMNSHGYTEAHYRGPLGEGAGLLLPSVRQSPFYPDGYYLHRSFWLANNALLDHHPKLALAFLVAQQEALSALCAKGDPGAVSDLVKPYWKLEAEDGATVVKDDVLFLRGWSWPTEADATALLEVSKSLVDSKAIAAPLSWEQVKGAFARTAPLARQAYDLLGAKPDDAEFVRTGTSDLRGRPVWQIDRWAARS
ncbi:ABC transporter substrate-binding protein [Methylobacterium sp. JK268]